MHCKHLYDLPLLYYYFLLQNALNLSLLTSCRSSYNEPLLSCVSRSQGVLTVNFSRALTKENISSAIDFTTYQVVVVGAVSTPLFTPTEPMVTTITTITTTTTTGKYTSNIYPWVSGVCVVGVFLLLLPVFLVVAIVLYKR